MCISPHPHSGSRDTAAQARLYCSSWAWSKRVLWQLWGQECLASHCAEGLQGGRGSWGSHVSCTSPWADTGIQPSCSWSTRHSCTMADLHGCKRGRDPLWDAGVKIDRLATEKGADMPWFCSLNMWREGCGQDGCRWLWSPRQPASLHSSEGLALLSSLQSLEHIHSMYIHA